MKFVNAEGSGASLSNGELTASRESAVLFVHEGGGESKKITVPDGASLRLFSVYSKGAKARNSFAIGEKCRVEVTELFIGNTEVRNELPLDKEGCMLKLSAKGAVGRNESARYEALASAGANARNADINVEEHAYLLGAGAEANLLPALEIGNNDVSARHASTIREIDAEQVFYLMSRGLSEAEARKGIVSGFFSREIAEIKALFNYEVKI